MSSAGQRGARATAAEDRLEGLARLHGPRVVAYLSRRVQPREDAADLWQHVLTTTWRKIHRVPDDDEAALCWLLAVARRELANHRRGSARRLAATERLRAVIAGGEHAAYPSGPGADPDPAAYRVADALRALGEDERELVTLTYWDGLTSEQAAAVVGTSAATARKRLQRARERLAVILDTSTSKVQPTGGESAGHGRASVVTGGRA